MYRVLICDDENIITDGLCEFIYKNRSEEYDTIKTYSSKSALDAFRRMRVDILVTDIEMPGVDGIALHKIVRDKWPETRTIFLTSYGRFDYAYHAAQHLNTRFILKSEGMSNVLKLIDEAGREITNALTDSRLLEYDPAESHWQGALVQNVFLQKLVRNEMDSDTIREGFELWEVPLKYMQPVYPVLIYRKVKVHSGNEVHLAKYLSTQTASLFRLYLLHLDDDTTLGLYQANGEDVDYRLVQQRLELLQPALEQLLAANLVVVVADRPYRWEELNRCFQTMERQKNLFADSDDTVICALGSDTGQGSWNLVGDRIDRFIETHYAEEISLADISASVYLSSSYTSRLYRKVRGVNLMDKITQTRVDKAIELLVSTNMKVQDVAASVGFQSPRYFVSVFKRHTGMSPGDYREQFTKR